MAENSNNISTLTMVDVLNDQNELENDAHAVLGASDQNNCTYDLGYINRQAVFSCTTCSDYPNEPAAVCLACCLECHDGHELVELYTKRFVRCDCGNEKFSNLSCKLRPGKALNHRNKYNQNYRGLYCTCHKSYPDPDDDIEDEMLQCIVCEDWYHSRHLNSTVPKIYEEMICDHCMNENSFLKNYMLKSEDAHVDVVSEIKTDELNISKSEDKENCTVKSDCNIDTNSKTNIQTSKDCSLTNTYVPEKKAMFWEDNWRSKLCKCNSCLDMYEKNNLKFLIDLNDTVKAYEESGKKLSIYDQGMEEFDKMERTQKVDFIHEYNDMKNGLTDYLKKFAENGKVVREEDIKEFFSSLESRKKQKLYTGLQMNCK